MKTSLKTQIKKANEKWLKREGTKKVPRKANAWKEGPFSNAAMRKKR